MATKSKRVFEIAKELGVTSKAIVEKCQAEGVPGVTNHMSTVKRGLEETIRQWFADDAAGTAVETSEQVDLQKAQRRPRRAAAKSGGAAAKAKSTAQGGATAEGSEEAAQGESPASAPAGGEAGEASPESQPAAEASAPSAEATPAAEPRASDETPAQASAPASQPEASPSASDQGEAAAAGADAGAAEAEKPQPRGQQNVPDRPAEVKPAGKKLDQPQEARLKGPKVVRVEQQEEEPPRRGRSGGGGPSRAPQQPAEAPGSVPGIKRTGGPERGRGAGGGEGGESKPRTKRRSRTSRRGRSADALPSGPTKFSEQDMLELDARLKGAPGFLKKQRRDLKKQEDTGQGGQPASPADQGGKVQITEPITIKDLSAATGIKSAGILKYLFNKGIMTNINAAIDTEVAMEIALEYDIELEVQEQRTAAEQIEQEYENREAVDVRPRPPVVTVLGHVDHGKTSLLDKIRKADVVAGESGGITQHVGAYRVTVEGTDQEEKTVVFLDTPGHAAFTSMRARGANLTDLVVIVVAADDGVMPQTVESINHAKASGVPIIVALNKVDKPEVDDAAIQRIYGQLAEHELHPVEWGGETEVVKVSATEGTGVAEMLEVLDYQATLMDLQADYGGSARGRVVEAEMQEGRGPVARVLVQAGQLRVGDFVVIGRAFGRVRDLTNDRGESVSSAGPATPVEISGIDLVPDAGDKCFVTQRLQRAEEVATQYREAEREKQLATKNKVSLDNLAEQLKAGQVRELRVVLKADVQGSIDVLRQSLGELGTSEVQVRVLHSAVGGVTESDVLLAEASDAIIVGFHVAAPAAVRETAEQRGVDIRLYNVIYDLTEDVKRALEGLLEPEVREQTLGEAEVRQVFKISKLGNVAGCLVTDGSVERGAKARVIREDVVVADDREIASVRRVKDEVREVRAGTECGIRLSSFGDVKAGDRIVCFRKEQVRRSLEASAAAETS